MARIPRKRTAAWLLLVGLTAVLVAAAFAAASAAPAAAAISRNFLVAQVALIPQIGSQLTPEPGHPAPPSEKDLEVDVCAHTPPIEPCTGSTNTLVIPWVQLALGATLWFVPSTPLVAGFFAAVTDGIVDAYAYQIRSFGAGATGHFTPAEPTFWGNQVGPNGIDLGGFTIPRIGVRTDAISFSHPTPDTTHASWRGTIVVEAALGSKNVCKKGGWQHLHRMNGTPFKNQGDCIQYFNTGK